MRSFVTCTVLASVASMAAAQLGHPLFEYPDTVPVEKRQEPGTPRYQCHEDCGLLISLGREAGYCSNSEWNDRYGRCMTCANQYGIWMYYSAGVTSAAAECGLTPVPSPSGGAAVTTAAPATTTAAPAPTTTAAPPPSDTAAEPATISTAAAPPAGQSSSAAGTPATTLSTQASTAASGTASGAATTSAGTSGSSTATVTRVTSIGTSVVIPSGTPTPSVIFAGAGKNAAAVGLTFVGMALAAF